MQAAAQYLGDRGAGTIVSVGSRFGGGQSLQLVMSGEELAGTVVYYGFLTSDADIMEAILWLIRGIFGGEDQAVSADSVRTFGTALENLSIENQILIYSNVGHAFANPSGDAWAPDATVDAWGRTLEVFYGPSRAVLGIPKNPVVQLRGSGTSRIETGGD